MNKCLVPSVGRYLKWAIEADCPDNEVEETVFTHILADKWIPGVMQELRWFRAGLIQIREWPGGTWGVTGEEHQLHFTLLKREGPLEIIDQRPAIAEDRAFMIKNPRLK